jgi:hypothetical protein
LKHEQKRCENHQRWLGVNGIIRKEMDVVTLSQKTTLKQTKRCKTFQQMGKETARNTNKQKSAKGCYREL